MTQHDLTSGEWAELARQFSRLTRKRRGWVDPTWLLVDASGKVHGKVYSYIGAFVARAPAIRVEYLGEYETATAAKLAVDAAVRTSPQTPPTIPSP